MKHIIPFVFLFFCALNFQAQTIDQSTSIINFSVSNFGLMSVDGVLVNMNGTVEFNSDNMDLCRFDVCVDVSSIDTGNEERDAHLLEADFFNAEKHPKICFYSEDVVETNLGYAVTGTLNMKGVEKIETITFTYKDQSFNGDLFVNRLDYGVGPDGGFTVGKEIEINIAVSTY